MARKNLLPVTATSDEAAGVCKLFGDRLPTLDDVHSLVNMVYPDCAYYLNDEHPLSQECQKYSALSKEGVNDFLPDAGYSFWTGSIDLKTNAIAVVSIGDPFNGYLSVYHEPDDGNQLEENYDTSHYFRCVYQTTQKP